MESLVDRSLLPCPFLPYATLLPGALELYCVGKAWWLSIVDTICPIVFLNFKEREG